MGDDLSELGFGIIGIGAVSPLHLAAIESSPGARLAAVADVTVERAKRIGEQRGVPWFADYREMLASPDVDVVCVCTPSGLRGEICIAAARAGRHVVSEKPVEVTLAKIDAVIEECGRAGVKLAAIHQIRFAPGVQAVKQAILEGRLGRLVMGDAMVKWFRSQEYYDSAAWRGTWALDGGGALMNQGIHYVDLLQWMMGPVETVFGCVDTLVRDIEVEDTAAACLKFTNGAVGIIEACTSAYKGVPAKLEIRGDKGVVIVEDGNVTHWQIEGEDCRAPEAVDIGSGASNPMAIGSAGHTVQISDMVCAINENRSPLVDGLEARKPVEIITAVYRSSRTGEAVKLPLGD